MAKVKVLEHLAEHFQQSEMCRKCILSYHKLYQQGKTNNPFPVSCRGDSSVPPPGIENNREAQQAFLLSDPSTWAEFELEDPKNPGKSMEYRSYQSEIVRCTAKRSVVRMGRRTGKTFGIITKMLHRMFIQKTTIIVLVPHNPANVAIFRAIDDLMRGSKILQQCISRRVKNPRIIEFKNGSRIEGFIINSGTGTNPDKIRGQGADILYVDEADFIPPEDFTPVWAILMDNKDAEFWMTSTPSGLKEVFYFNCTEKDRGWREHYHSCLEHPDWAEMEADMREQYKYNKIGWDHEVMALFAEVEGGVYSTVALENSVEKYTYDAMRRQDECIYALGVDWNGHPIGDVGIVVEYNPQSNKFKVVDKFISAEKEYTQLKAIQKIIEVSQKWKIDQLWVDSGYGSPQIEMLKKYAIERPELKLIHKIKGIQMGGKTEVRDPWTGGMIKKRNKSLIVSITAEKIARGNCIFPSAEEPKGGLVDQLRSLRIKRMGLDGDPVFEESEDHAMVAWQCAVYAIMMKYSDINSSIGVSHIDVAPTIMRNGRKLIPLQDTGSMNIEPDLLNYMRKDIMNRDDRSVFHSPQHGASTQLSRKIGGMPLKQNENKRGNFSKSPFRRTQKDFVFGQEKRPTRRRRR